MPDPAISGALKRPFAQQVAFFRGKLGNLVPTARYTDMQRSAHDTGFMVAGAQSADLLAGLAAAVEKTISQGGSIESFRKDFAALVKSSGWDYNGEFNWRTRTIYRTNMSTSYAAGRLAQLREGNFPLYLYRHGDSLEPRLQHLAWDGLVLPADHPFWSAHYPPNGWGCSCRVVGVRSAEAAARLGGDPDKQLADNWNAIDPKTGAPVGIGTGWDYQPGNTVSDAVSAMAAKTQQWEYTLAKAYMQGVPISVRDALAIAYRDLPSVASDTRLYAQRILEKRSALEIAEYRTMGLLTQAQATRVGAATGIDVTGFDFALDRFAPKHIFTNHGVATSEAQRGQRAVVAADYARLPELINAPDSADYAGLTDIGRPVMSYAKKIGGETFVAVFEVRPKRKSLSLVTFYVQK